MIHLESVKFVMKDMYLKASNAEESMNVLSILRSTIRATELLCAKSTAIGNVSGATKKLAAVSSVKIPISKMKLANVYSIIHCKYQGSYLGSCSLSGLLAPNLYSSLLTTSRFMSIKTSNMRG